MRNVVSKPTEAAPIKTGNPVLDPVIKNAATIPGSMAWEIASLIMDVFRTIRNDPANAHAMAVRQPVNMIQTTSTEHPEIIPAK